MKINVATADFEHYDCGKLLSDKIVFRGYVELDEFDAEKAFDLCNWDCWADEKPREVHTDISRIGHGLIVFDEMGTAHLALSSGWLSGSADTIRKYLRRHMNDVLFL